MPQNRDMDETEEDVLFVTMHQSASKEGSSTVPRSTGKLIKTFALFASFLGLGLCISVTGPTLPYLEDRIGVGVDKISVIFTGRSLGYLTGSMGIGWLFDRFGGHHDIIFAIGMVAIGLSFVLMPWATSLVALALLTTACGLAMGGLDTVGNAVCLQLWGPRSPPYMQALHFSFGIGAVLAPLIAAPFLDHHSGSAASSRTEEPNVTALIANLSSTSATATAPGLNASHSTDFNETSESSTHWMTSRKIRHSQMFDSRIDNVQFVYLLMSSFIFAVALVFAAFEVRRCITGAVQKFVQKDAAKEVLKRTERSFLIKMLVLLFFFYMCYAGLEDSYGQFLATFAIDHAGFSEDDASLLTAVYWGVFTLGRGCAVLVARHMSPARMIMASFACSLGALMFLCFAQSLHAAILWVFSGVLGFGFAALYPSGFTWAENHLHISGKVTSIFVVGSSVGGMVLPASMGVLIAKLGSMYLMYAITGFTIISTIIFALLCALTGTFCANASKYSVKEAEHIAMRRLDSKTSDAVVATASEQKTGGANH